LARALISAAFHFVGRFASMTTTPQERGVIVDRLAEIKGDPNSNPAESSPEQTSAGEKLDSEITRLLRKLADDDCANLCDT